MAIRRSLIFHIQNEYHVLDYCSVLEYQLIHNTKQWQTNTLQSFVIEESKCEKKTNTKRQTRNACLMWKPRQWLFLFARWLSFFIRLTCASVRQILLVLQDGQWLVCTSRSLVLAFRSVRIVMALKCDVTNGVALKTGSSSNQLFAKASTAQPAAVVGTELNGANQTMAYGLGGEDEQNSIAKTL